MGRKGLGSVLAKNKARHEPLLVVEVAGKSLRYDPGSQRPLAWTEIRGRGNPAVLGMAQDKIWANAKSRYTCGEIMILYIISALTLESNAYHNWQGLSMDLAWFVCPLYIPAPLWHSPVNQSVSTI